jgi:hypothetical protein
MDNPDSFYVQYCSSNSILVINPTGRLRQVFTPFRVSGIEPQDGKRRVYIVDEVRSDGKDQLIYIICGQPYHHFHFTIDIRF